MKIEYRKNHIYVSFSIFHLNHIDRSYFKTKILDKSELKMYKMDKWSSAIPQKIYCPCSFVLILVMSLMCEYYVFFRYA